MNTITTHWARTARRFAAAAALGLLACGAAATPAGAEAADDTASAAAVVSGKRITIERGDSLLRLAKEHGVTVEAIKAANGMEDTRLTAGLTLIIPVETPVVPRQRPVAPGSYTIQKGDSLYSIAKRHGLRHQELARANGITDPTDLQPGQVVIIPGRVPARSARHSLPVWTPPASRALRTPPAASRRASAVTAARPKPSAGALDDAPAATAALPSAAEEARLFTPADLIRPAPGDPVSEDIARLEARAAAEHQTATGFRWPVPGNLVQVSAIAHAASARDGITIAVPRGTPVAAAESGIVAYAGNELSAYGNLVLVRHAGDWLTAYAHNSSLHVKRGDAVRRGQIIATAGQTGSVRRPQLRFELWKGTRPVDPLPHLAAH